MKRLLTTAAAVICMALAMAVSAQDASPAGWVYYLLEQQGIRQLMRVQMDGTTEAISTLEQSSVIAYDTDGQTAAYVTRPEVGPLSLYLTPIGDPTAALSVVIPAAEVFDLHLTETAIYLVSQGADGLPVLYGYDRALQPIVERPVALEGAIQTLSPSRNWALAYHPSGAYGLYALPSTTRATVDLSATGYTPLVWSPSADQIQVVGVESDLTAPFLQVVDVTAAVTARYPLPSLPESDVIQSVWSGAGRYVVYSVGATPDTLLLTDIATGSQVALSEPGFILSPVAWSANDEWLLYVTQLGAANPDLFAFNPESGSRTPLRTGDAFIASTTWADDTAALAAITVNSDNTVSILATTAPFETWRSLITLDDGRFAQSTVYWVGSNVILEHDQALLAIDAVTNELIRLTPETFPVVSGSVRVVPS